MAKPIWKNMLEYNCPSCGRNPFPETADQNGNFKCPDCGFFIRAQRYSEIMSDMELGIFTYKKKYAEADVDNSALINNL